MKGVSWVGGQPGLGGGFARADPVAAASARPAGARAATAGCYRVVGVPASRGCSDPYRC